MPRTISGALCAALATAGLAFADPPAAPDRRWDRAPSATCATSATPVTLSSAEAARTAGFEYATVQSAPLSRAVERNCELAYNANRYARLSSRAMGVVAEVTRDLGAPVKKGELLAVIDSPDLGSTKSDLLLALQTVQLWETRAARERWLVDQRVGTELDALEAEMKAAQGRIEVNRARQRLRNLGLANPLIESVEKESDTSSLLQILAPFDGTVVERTAVMGEVVEPGKPLLAVADTTLMWAMVDLAEADLALVRSGQQAAVTLDGLPGMSFTGPLTWISTQVDPRTRTLKARVELDNAEGLLRANMFGRARISAGDNRMALTVPKEAVQWEGCCNVAFVRADAQGLSFKPARLVLAFDAGDRYEVTGGLSAGDVIVTRGSFILKNEILKNSVGAGCCEVDHLKK